MREETLFHQAREQPPGRRAAFLERACGALVRGELDWIVMRALEKDRSRRYESASALGRDIERYLADEPVEACPPAPATGCARCCGATPGRWHSWGAGCSAAD